MSRYNYFNAEHYPDPTAYEALSVIEKEIKEKDPYRPLVYICSPYAGDVETNAENARRYCRFAVDRNVIPFAPHLLYPQIMDDGNKKQRKLGLFFGLVWLGKCQEMWVFGDRISEGMMLEIAKAQQLKRIKIRYFNAECKEVEENNGNNKHAAQRST